MTGGSSKAKHMIGEASVAELDSSGADFYALTKKANALLQYGKLDGHTVSQIRVGHAPDINRDELRTAYRDQRSLLASQLRKGRVAAESATEVERMVEITELALKEAEESAELSARQRALHLKGTVSRLAREAAQALSLLSQDLGAQSGNFYPSEVPLSPSPSHNMTRNSKENISLTQSNTGRWTNSPVSAVLWAT